MSSNSIRKKFCNDCNRYTSHKLSHSESINEEEFDPEFECSIGWHKGYSVYQCLGCNDFFMECWKWFSEWDHEDAVRKRFPPEQTIQKPNWLHELPKDIRQLMDEIYLAIQNDCSTLACSGLRTVLDRLMVDKLGDIGTFKQKVKKMCEAGFFGANQEETILAVIEAGSASAHRSYTPNEATLKSVLNITEHVLEAIYIHPKEVNSIKQSTPNRENNIE